MWLRSSSPGSGGCQNCPQPFFTRRVHADSPCVRTSRADASSGVHVMKTPRNPGRWLLGSGVVLFLLSGCGEGVATGAPPDEPVGQAAVAVEASSPSAPVGL